MNKYLTNRLKSFVRQPHLRMVRCCILFLLWFAVRPLAASVVVQTPKLQSQPMTIRKVCDYIRKNTNYTIIYQGNIDQELNKTIQISVAGKDVFELLREAIIGTDLTFHQVGDEITLTKNSELAVHQSVNQFGGKDLITLSGVIMDAQNHPIVGAQISEDGASNGTMTDMSGHYTLIVSPHAILNVSFLGYKNMKVFAGKSSRTRNIVMFRELKRNNADTLTVGVGYGSVMQSDLTGAVTLLKSKDFSETPAVSLENMIIGKIPGVQIISEDAQPGGGFDIQVRGAGSALEGNTPLYVIDGFPVDNVSDPDTGGRYKISEGARSPLNSLNPNDIASIEVLKDAGTAAIYGARASNGVILITTKKGKKGRPRVSYDMKFGVQKVGRTFQPMDASTLYQTRNAYDKERWLIDHQIAPYGTTDPSTVTPFTPTYSAQQIAAAGKGTDWENAIMQTGVAQEHNVSVSGATDKTNYWTSFNFFDQSGVLKNNELTRYSGRVNLTHQLLNNLKLGLNLTGSHINTANPTMGLDDMDAGGTFESAHWFSPDLPVRSADGSYANMQHFPQFQNPVSMLEIDNKTVQNRFLGQFFAEYKPIDGLTLKLQAGLDRFGATTKLQIPTTLEYGANVGGENIKDSFDETDGLLSLTADYVKQFSSKHKLEVMLGAEWNGINQTSSTYDCINAASSQNITTGINSNNINRLYREHFQMLSYFGRANYSLMDKYLFTLGFRADGYNKFTRGNRWGVFPSFTSAWQMKKERFLKTVDWLSQLKLRFSIGQTANSNIIGSQLGGRSMDWQRDYIYGNKIMYNGRYYSPVVDNNLKWETTTEYNFGFDAGFFKDRLSVSMDFYWKTIHNVLQQESLSDVFDDIYAWQNRGSAFCRGLDLGITSQNFKGNFAWTTSFNLSTYLSRWTSRNPNDTQLGSYESAHDYLRGYWGYHLDGLWQPGETSYRNTGPGSPKVIDVNGDGKIGAADLYQIANRYPKLSIGFNNTFNYKHFDLVINIYGLLGYKKYNSALRAFVYGATGVDSYITQGLNYPNIPMSKFWSSRYPNAKYPNIFNSGLKGPAYSQFTLDDASFVRIKNITLGYDLSYLGAVKKYLSKARVFVDVANPAVFTRFVMLDPEYSWIYPPSTTISFGLNVTF